MNFYTIAHYMRTTVTIIDRAMSNYTLRKNKGIIPIVGIYTVYPPFYNGASLFITKLFKKLMHRKDIKIVAIPYKNRIDKSLLTKVLVAKPENKYLDVTILFTDSRNIQCIPPQCKKISWHTVHFAYGENRDELESYEPLKKSDLILAPTRFAEKQLKKAGLKKVVYLPLGVDINEYTFSDQKSKKILFVSRSHYYKGIMPFLDSIPLVLKKMPEALFNVHSPIDKNNPYLDEFTEKINALKRRYPHNIVVESSWVSFEDMQKKFADAAILIFPSNNEGFGIPLIEAMASGTVCITSDRAPMNELVEDNKTGYCLLCYKQRRYHDFVFPKPEEIAQKIIYILTHEKVRSTFTYNARKKVEEQYDLDKIAERLVEYCKKITPHSSQFP